MTVPLAEPRRAHGLEVWRESIAAARVVEVIPRTRGAPIGQEADQSAILEVAAHLVLGKGSKAEPRQRRLEDQRCRAERELPVYPDRQVTAALVELPCLQSVRRQAQVDALVVEALLKRGVELPGMVGLVRSGRLPVATTGERETGLKRLRFAASLVRAVCRELEGERLAVQAAAERIGLKWEVVTNLVARGLLRSEGDRSAAADADAFMTEHVTGGQLARERGTSPRALAAALAKAGVLPLGEASGGRVEAEPLPSKVALLNRCVVPM